MEQIKVSVIIPVYNTEPYVKQTVESIMKQTLHDIEIIIINDGSTDNSLSILSKLADLDNRIKIYSQTNQGLSVSRNAGMQKATGEYIYFMDSDDLLEKDTLESCYQKCISEQLDFVFFDAESFCDENIFLRKYQYQRSLKIEEKVWNGLELLKIQDATWNYRSSACLSFTKLIFLKKNNIQFYPHILHEDELYTAQLYLNATRINYIKRNFFKRRIRSNSITTIQFSMKNMNGYFTVANELKKYKNRNNSKIINNHLAKVLNAAVWNASKLPVKDRLHIARCCIFNYFGYVSCKTIGILLFKSLLKK